MSKDNNFFEDLAKLSGSAMNVMFNSVADCKRQFDVAVQDKVQELCKQGNFVSREEFEVVKKLAQKAVDENAKLRTELEALNKKAESGNA